MQIKDCGYKRIVGRYRIGYVVYIYVKLAYLFSRVIGRSCWEGWEVGLTGEKEPNANL